MKKNLALLLAFAFPGLLAAQEWILFEDSSVAFTANYPSSWTKKIKGDGTIVFYSPLSGESDRFQENMNVIVRNNPVFTTTFDFTEAMPSIIERLSSTLTDFKKKSIRYFKWNDKPAAELKFTITGKTDVNEATHQIKMMQWYCTGEGVFYTATFTSLQDNDQFDADALKVFQSIRFR